MLKEVAPDGSVLDRRSETCGANQSAPGVKCIKMLKLKKAMANFSHHSIAFCVCNNA